jgi:hypothetical protein
VRALVVSATVAAIAAILLGAVAPVEAIRIYLLGLVGLAGFVACRKTLSRFGRLERTRRRRKRVTKDPVTPPFFERATRRVELANTSGVYFEQLRPRLREIAEQRLAGRGLRMTGEEASGLLGAEAWLALERPPEGDKFAAPEVGRLRRVVESLERI